ncbi:hypothetical protein EAG_03874 [Camponotus floridanus]|uniref:HTH OST-type domain-containing protein n=1 Tax=Camponotus floridanus TaxID=104421 RepID=E2A7I8_CAMFO|nr:hypothetical protein EAG_03874 [Camponotus floridanus]
MEETIALIKSCIISKKGGVPIGDLNDEFQNLVGEPIPYRRLGFSSLRAFLRIIDGLETKRNEFGEQILKINDSKIAHIDRLIRYQKVDYSKTKNKYYKQFAHRKNNSEYNDDRRQRNRATHNINRANKRIEDLDYRRDPYLSKTHGFHENNSFSYEEENHCPVVIELNETKEITSIHEPTASGQQLLGDDFFLQLAIRNLHLPIWRYKDNLALHCGLCISGQTISDCTRSLRNISTISNRVVILLGSVDVYNGATCEEMIYDMTELLQVLRSKFHLSNSAITICTIPPLANLSIYAYKKQSLALFCFNNWIRSLADDASRRDASFESYPIIDLFESFCNETYVTEYDWFQTSLMRLHDNSAESNHRIVNDNFNLKNHVKRLKEDVQKKEQALCEAQERERRLKVQCESVSRDLKHEKEEIRKLKKQAQSKDIQHEHEIRRIMRNSEKLQEQLQKSLGTFVSKDKVLQMMQTDHEKELTSYKQTICRLEENNRQMLEEINNLKQILELHKNAIDLQVEASGWTSTNI